MKVFKVTLEPKDWFFFGGSSTFDNGTKTSYIAHSLLFPQQTALLGMIRYQLLKQNNLLFDHGGKPDDYQVIKLIGEKSFSMRDDNQKTYGDILGLSPVFLEEYKDGDEKSVTRKLFPLALTNSYNLSFGKDVKVFMTDRVKKLLIDDSESFEYKSYDNYMKYGDKDGNSLLSYDIFETRMQVGITKNTDFKPEEGEKEQNFFKHKMVRFCKNMKENTTFRYAFYVKLNSQELKKDFVFLGAERSCFDMAVNDVKDDADLKKIYLESHPLMHEQGRIELLSPTYVEDIEKLEELCNFHWSNTTTFRNITFNKDGKGKLNSGNVSYNRGEICYNMLSAGSVIFFDEANRMEIEKLLNNAHLQTIGYNYFNSMNNNKTE